VIQLALVAALLSAGADADVVARVDGQAITSAAFARRFAADASKAYRERPDLILSTMIDEQLLTGEGHRLGLERSPVAQARFELLQRLEAGALFLRREIEGKISPSDQLLRETFHSTADSAAFEMLAFETSEQAAAALGRIRKGGSFAAEAPRAAHSQLQPHAEMAPLVIRAEMSPALAAALFGATPGSVVGPVELADGFGIVKLLRKNVGTEEEFARKREQLVAYAKIQLAERMKGHVLAQLRTDSKVTVDEAFLRSLPDGEPTAEQLDHVIATTGGGPIRYADLADDVRALSAARGHLGPSLRVTLAWRLVDQRLLQDVAVARGLLKDPALVALQAEHREAAVGWAAAVRLMDSASAPTDREIGAFFERNAASFDQPLPKVRPQATAGAAREKRQAAFSSGVAALRQKAAISIDRDALARAAKARV
jgi:peptidyl-prolyl cis-trans isomerase C